MRVACPRGNIASFVSGLTMFLVLLAFPAVSKAGCGGTQVAPARSHPAGQLPPLALGDSTMILSLPGLSADGYTVNAHGCRTFTQALGMLGQLKAQRALPHMVAIALGANGYVTRADIESALRLLCCGRVLVLVTPRQLGGGSGSNAANERAEARAHRDRLLLLDWVGFASGHPNWFQPDGLHLTFPGVAGFNSLLVRALPYAFQPCPPSARRGAPRRTRKRPRRPLVSASGQGLPASTPSFKIHATLGHLGYVDVTLSGPPAVNVQLSEQRSGKTQPIGTFTLSSSGTATVPRALKWLCAPRTRTLSAMTLPPATPATATTSIHTPSCGRRLGVAIDPRARAGGQLSVRLTDRWGSGDLRTSICLAAPGSRAGCSNWYLHVNQRRRVVRLATPRIGGWKVTVRSPGGEAHARTTWVSHPGSIRILAAGDSEMQILDSLIGQDTASHGVSVTSDARISTGLTNSFFFDWQGHARAQAPSLKPDVTVIFMGANDGFAVRAPNGHSVSCCSSAWSSGYATLVAQLMRTYLQGNRGRVYWFLLPVPRPGNFQYLFRGVNAGIRQAGRRFPGRVGLIDANAFFTPGGRYRDFMTYSGHGFVIHEPDGIHLSTASDQVAATLLSRRLLTDRVLR
jgi:lysophospholipase L1-like esterase